MCRSYYDKKVRLIRDLYCGEKHIYLKVEKRRVLCKTCGTVKQEKVDWLANNPFYTKRFALLVGRRCRESTITDVAEDFNLDWKTVKDLDKEYMQKQLERCGCPGPEAIGVDEISVKKGHSYRIVVSDLKRRRAIWFGTIDRSKVSMDKFYEWLGEKKRKKIRLAVMDMWKPFEESARENVPESSILYDKFHVMKHLGEALDQIRKLEYARVTGKDRRFIKGQKYTLLSRNENLKPDGRASLEKLLKVNHRLNTAYVLKETFSQLWEYDDADEARKFFENWKASLKWQRLEPYQKFAQMIERHWDGIAAYCEPENKVALGFVEGLNNKIRVLQRRAYGFHDEEYLRLKVLTCMLPRL